MVKRPLDPVSVLTPEGEDRFVERVMRREARAAEASAAAPVKKAAAKKKGSKK